MSKKIKHIKKPEKVDDRKLYLISRHNGWFRPNAQGYTINYCDAGIYTGVEAKRYLDVEGVTVVPLTKIRKNLLDEINLYEENIKKLRKVLVALDVNIANETRLLK